jgi:polygalacturonase
MKLFLMFLLIVLTGWAGGNEKICVCDFGAVGDGKTNDTNAIQKAIDSGSESKQIVFFPAGEYYLGPIFFRSNTVLELSDSAVLKGSTDTIDYKSPKTGQKLALINAESSGNIRIFGRGKIDGNGGAIQFKTFNGDRRNHRPNLIAFSNCTNVTVNGISLVNSASWMQHYYKCQNLRIENINVFNHVNMNNDGLDIDNCSDVIVSGCIIDSDDDALCLKSTDNTAVCSNVTVTNCILASNCNAIKLGTESLGGFKQVNVSDCVVKKASESSFWGRHHGLGAIVLDLVDGGIMEGISVSGINISGFVSPFFIRLGDRGRMVKDMTKPQPAGKIENIIITGVTANLDSSAYQGVISGIPGHCIENVKLSNIQLIYGGGINGNSSLRTEEIPELNKDYPEAIMFGRKLPVFGLMARHTRNLQISNFSVKPLNPDGRYALLLNDAGYTNISNLVVMNKKENQTGIYVLSSESCQFENVVFNNKPKEIIQSE